MLNYADSNSFFVSFPAYLKTVENVKEDVGILQVLRFEFLKFRILDLFLFSPMQQQKHDLYAGLFGFVRKY